MKHKHFTRTGLILAGFLIILLAACGLPSKPTATQPGPEALYTSAAQTVQAQLTQNVKGTQVVVPSQTPADVVPTASQAPTETPLPTATLVPSATLIPPTATAVPIPCDRASFVKDLTYPDNEEVEAGTTFVKTWRLLNNGSCTWNSSYNLVFDSGDAMSGPASVQLTSGTVAPGQTIDISVTLKAPDTTKTYQGYWKLRNGAGVVFGVGDSSKAFWVKVAVVKKITPTPAVTPITGNFDFVSKGPNASWYNATKSLPWGDRDEDDAGVAVSINGIALEDGNTYDNLLATYPQTITDGLIYGVYPPYKILESGYHFRSKLTYRLPCVDAQATFSLRYLESGAEKTLGEWTKSCDGTLMSVDLDLSSLAGKTVQFILKVQVNGQFESEHAIWIAPRIEK
jgi:hypothetical protein